MGKQSFDVDSKPRNPYGPEGSKSSGEIQMNPKLYFMLCLSLFTLYGVAKMIVPSNDGAKNDEWASKGDAAGGWGKEHNHAIVEGIQKQQNPLPNSVIRAPSSPSLSAPATPPTSQYDWETSAQHYHDNPPKYDQRAYTMPDQEIRESDFLMVLAPLVFVPTHPRPEYAKYQTSDISHTDPGNGGVGMNYNIEPETILYDLETPHGKAFDFILNRDKRRVDAEDPHLIQRFVLTLLFYATGGSCDDDPPEYYEDALANGSFGMARGWDSGRAHFLTSLHECHWVKKSLEDQFWGLFDMEGNEKDKRVGVTKCNIDMEITELRLADLNLVGFIPEEIKWLSGLQSLDLQNNHLAGPIPNSVGELDELRYLSLDGNNFSGSIPDVFQHLSHLERAYLNFNDFNGAMPPSLCTLREDGELSDLWSDCGGYPITCTCCTVCCDMVAECDEMPSQKGT